MTLLETMLDSANNWKSKVCEKCTHPYILGGCCSDINSNWGCGKCLDEIHFDEKAYQHLDPKGYSTRSKYDCVKLLHCYVDRYAERYYSNIKSACKNIDFGKYLRLNVLSLGCGSAPDLAALHELAAGKPVKYTGIDSNPCWSDLQRNIENYAQDEKNNLSVEFIRGDALQPSNLPQTEVYNVVVIQWFISTILKSVGTPGSPKRIVSEVYDEVVTIENIYSLFNDIVASATLRWRDSDLDSPFLFILDDVDHPYFGRDGFYKLIDILEESGYRGTAYAISSGKTDTLYFGANRRSDRKGKEGHDNVTYHYYSYGSKKNPNASLVIEVTK